MPTLRKSVLPVSSLALVAAAAAAILHDAAHAQTPVPVRYGTDPGYSEEAPQVLSFRGEDAPEPVGEIRHVVEAGETVYALARMYDVPPAAIIEKNRMVAPYGLQIGQVVMIPMGAGDPLPTLSEVAALDRQQLPSVPTPATRRWVSDRYDLDAAYEVRQGDTVYSISRRFGLSVADLAAANRLAQPYTISVGQRLVIPGAADRNRLLQEPRPIIAGSPTSRAPDQRALNNKVIEEAMAPRPLPDVVGSRFAWPVRGPVLMDFGDDNKGMRNDGINIAAPIGAPIRATADGEVVYRGNELDGYGNLLLVKHDGGWVSAYAHADAILVRKGDYVRQGQVIAKVGRSGNVDRPQLHFQLRKDLQPTDPIIAMQGELEGAGETLTAAGIRR